MIIHRAPERSSSGKWHLIEVGKADCESGKAAIQYKNKGLRTVIALHYEMINFEHSTMEPNQVTVTTMSIEHWTRISVNWLSPNNQNCKYAHFRAIHILIIDASNRAGTAVCQKISQFNSMGNVYAFFPIIFSLWIITLSFCFSSISASLFDFISFFIVTDLCPLSPHTQHTTHTHSFERIKK